ncbi:GNAT family N-acetyltransferase [Nocardia vaccinii]|uniref:GNAT family N-acetyltransferase n=1 Tax=Nocardia vaccinii TaxID=1822 RepID=UPI00082DAE17|nr:GNAT family N-acetyltransferase [Nocardia vaccinii]
MSDSDGHITVITRVSKTQWQAMNRGLLVGSGDVSPRPDGRLFVSIDSWREDAFGALAAAMLADLPRPLYTVVDETDRDLATCWGSVGFTTRRREWECLVPTDPRITGLDAVAPPSDTAIVAAGAAAQGPLREVDRAIRDEVEATIGWREMPAEVLPHTGADVVVDPSKYAVAAQSDRYVGLIRVVQVTRLPRIGLIAVRADQRRRGIARALLTHALGALHQREISRAAVELNESNPAALALFEGIGVERVNSNLELVLR